MKNFNLREDEIVFESFLKFSEFAFRLTLFDFSTLSESSTLREKIFHHVKINYYRVCLAGFFFGTISMCGYVVDHSDVFMEALACVPNITTIMLIGLKAFITFKRRDDLRMIIKEMAKIFNHQTDTKHKLKACLDEYQSYMRVYAIVFVAILIPVFYPIVDYVLYQKTELSVQYWFPIDVFRVETFPVAIIWTDWLAYIMTTHLLATDTLIYAIFTIIAMEFDVLSASFSNFHLIVKHERIDKLKSLVERHDKLLDLSAQLQDIYGLSVLFSFVGSSLIICFVTFHLSIAGSFYDYMLNIPFLLMMGGQILLLCMFGQKLINASESVAEAVYNCGWETFIEVEFRKQLVVIMARSQKPAKLSAMGFADISLPTFTSVSF